MADIDIYRSANLMIHEHGSNAAIEAAMRADALLARGPARRSMIVYIIVVQLTSDDSWSVRG